MAGGRDFATSLHQLTQQLHHDHQREVDALTAEIERLKFALDLYTSSATDGREGPTSPGRRPVDGEPGALEARPSGGSSAGNLRLPASDLPSSDGSRRGAAGKRGSSGGGASKKTLKFSQTFQSNNTYRGHPIQVFLYHLVRSSYFEATSSVLVALNAIVISMEAQYYGLSQGAALGFYENDPSSSFEWAEDLFVLLGRFFGVLFTCEILLRIIGLRSKFIYEFWNWMDLAVVVLWFLGQLEDNLPINPQLIRLTRLAKLVRLVRLVKKINGLDSLFLITTSLKDSLSILAWTCCLLCLVLMLNALLLNQFLMEFYFKDESRSHIEREEVYRYFGSFTTSFFSMFELTLANWAPISRKLYENVNEWFIVITIFHKLVIGFAVVGVINGVFMQETFEVAHHDDEIMLRRGRHAALVHAEKMRRLVATTAKTGDWELDRAEFRGIFDDPGLKAWLATMDLVPQDPDVLFEMMADGKRVVTVDDLISGMAAYKGTAKNLDLHILMHDHRRLQATVDRHLAGPRQPPPAEPEP